VGLAVLAGVVLAAVVLAAGAVVAGVLVAVSVPPPQATKPMVNKRGDTLLIKLLIADEFENCIII
jgi:hypothetical protein